MALPEVALRTAEKHVSNYEAESALMAAHQEALECLDCEAFLDLGIDAFNWLMKATKVVRTVALREDDEAIERAEASLRAWRKAWLGPCDLAETWAGLQIARGFNIENLDKFRACCAAMRQIVADDARRDAAAAHVAPVDVLSQMAIAPPQDWLDEPSWTGS
ncbi:MAG: hypothetical protein DCC68_06510 [Planctomycetota bacterium]|nr:MAG: hypothetical protein DCC68_06510 [Planctomycetota bacterium]